MPKKLILVVEDEQNIASLLSVYLEKEGFAVELATDGAQGLRRARELSPALILLDLMLPEIDGIEVCRRIRSESSVPIIMLTARGEEVDRIIGLELGADDYITKPFSPREVVARVKAVLRRSGERDRPEEEQMLELDDVRADLLRRRVTAGGREVGLTAREFDLLAFLIRNSGIVFSRDRLLERVWGWERAVESRTVDAHVKSLRRKLGKHGEVVRTVRGVGYKADAS